MVTTMPKPFLVYCDYIAHLISMEIKNADKDYCQLIDKASRAHYNTGPDGEFITKKTLFVTDVNGTRYRITVEEENETAVLV